MSGPFVDQLKTPAKLSAAVGERKPLTVLQMVDGRHIGEAEQTTRITATSVVSAGGRALIAAGGEWGHRVRVAGAETFSFAPESSLLNPRGNVSELIDMIDDAGVDIIHARSAETAKAGATAAAAIGAKLVITLHEPPSSGLLGGGARNLANADHVIAVSEAVANQVNGKTLTRDQITVIPPGADPNVFAEEVVGPARTIQLADDWGLAEDTRPILLAPGRLDAGGGHDILIRALTDLKAARGEDFLCIIVGDGDAKVATGVEAAAFKAGIAGVVKLVGGTDDPAAALKLAAVVVSAATTPPPAGREVIEAQAMGRPVIAPDHGAMTEIIQNGVSGWLTPASDVSALAAALNEALDMDESQRAHIGMAGRALVRARYTLDASTGATLAIYENLANRAFQTPYA